MRRFAFAITLAICALAACTKGETADPGLGAWLRVSDAQFVRGAMPSGKDDGPKALSITMPTNTVWPGLDGRSLTGALDSSAVSAAIAIDTDEGYWIVPAGPADVSTPTLPSYRASLAFSPTLAAGSYTLVVRAIDYDGSFGPPATQTLTALDASPALEPTDATLLVSLEWDSEADLDIHVIDPLGNEIFHGDPSSRPKLMPGRPPVTDAGSFGFLDADSNGQCVIDGRRRENVIWTLPPPSGRYVVRVDATSLCGAALAHWTTTAKLDGADLGGAMGTAVDADIRGAHDRGAGVTAFSFDVP